MKYRLLKFYGHILTGEVSYKGENTIYGIVQFLHKL